MRAVLVEQVSGYDTFGNLCGTVAAVSFFLVQVPQIYLNFLRKSTVGFSWEAIIIRTFGISFHVVNGILAAMSFPLLLTGFLLLTEMFVILTQFALYRQDRRFYIGFLIPIVPVMMSLIWPVTMEYTNYVNPVTQVACYIPFIYECVRVGTTRGISLTGQHLNFLGAVMGLLMCSVTCRCDKIGWLFYFISLGQVTAVYMLAFIYDEFRLFDSPEPNSL